jgi:hypothetical protein
MRTIKATTRAGSVITVQRANRAPDENGFYVNCILVNQVGIMSMNHTFSQNAAWALMMALGDYFSDIAIGGDVKIEITED